VRNSPLETKENHMTENLEIQDAPIFSYAIASGDMRYIEIGEREIYLRNDPKVGLIYRGEIAGCGPECHFELNEILLEFAMSCEGCREESFATKEVIQFGEHLGEVLLARTARDIAELPTIEKLSSVSKCMLNSMSARYIEEIKEDQLQYSLDCCPLRECAMNTGLNRNVDMAHLSFVALWKSLISNLAPGWVLMHPSDEEKEIPIHKIVIIGGLEP
jgi:hypothetical protein